MRNCNHYWDFNAPDIPNTLRDVSAAAITASALVELNGYTANKYNESLEKIMNSLSSEKYFSALSKNPKFVLKHSVGSIPHGAEIDEPLVYADYYYIEALLRMKNNNSIDQSIANNSE